jgi:hypothetical protein
MPGTTPTVAKGRNLASYGDATRRSPASGDLTSAAGGKSGCPQAPALDQLLTVEHQVNFYNINVGQFVKITSNYPKRYRLSRLDLHESGIIAKPFKRASTAICF